MIWELGTDGLLSLPSNYLHYSILLATRAPMLHQFGGALNPFTSNMKVKSHALVVSSS